MSALLSATLSNSDACVKAVIHSRDCVVCPRALADFLDQVGVFCTEGQRILDLIAASKREIARAVKQPMLREFAS